MNPYVPPRPMTLTPADRAAWARYEAENRRAVRMYDAMPYVRAGYLYQQCVRCDVPGLLGAGLVCAECGRKP